MRPSGVPSSIHPPFVSHMRPPRKDNYITNTAKSLYPWPSVGYRREGDEGFMSANGVSRNSGLLLESFRYAPGRPPDSYG